MNHNITRRDFLESLAAMGLVLPMPILQAATSSAPSSAPAFDVKHPRGLDFKHVNSPTPQKYLIETMGGGVALLDYNNDGLLDIFLVNSGDLTNPMHTPEKFNRQDPKNWNRLYRQNPDGSFTDVTKEAGLPAPATAITASASRSATTITTVFPISTSPATEKTSCIITTAMAPSPTSPPKPA